jgi:hypothetical protein
VKFEEFENIYIKENKKLRLLMAGISLGLVLIIVLVLSDKKYFVLRDSKLITSRPLLTWVCNESFMSIAKGKPQKDLILKTILDELKKNEFKVSAEDVLSSLEVKDGLCRIIVKGEGKVRSFLVSFKSSADYPFYYKLSEITESELNLDELSKISEAK